MVREAPGDPRSDPDLVRWGVRAQSARHYTRYIGRRVQVSREEYRTKVEETGLPEEALGHARFCQFIAGDPRHGASICGKRSKPGSSYCAKHHAVCYDRVVGLKRSAAGRKAWETRQRRWWDAACRGRGYGASLRWGRPRSSELGPALLRS